MEDFEPELDPDLFENEDADLEDFEDFEDDETEWEDNE